MSFDKLLNYDYSKIAYWMVFTGIVLAAAFIMILMGIIWSKKVSKRMGCFYGYKIAAAPKNEEAWTFVNRLAGRLWIMTGLILFVLDSIVMLMCMHGYYEQIRSDALVLLLIEVLAGVGCHFIIRRRVKKLFAPDK